MIRFKNKVATMIFSSILPKVKRKLENFLNKNEQRHNKSDKGQCIYNSQYCADDAVSGDIPAGKGC